MPAGQASGALKSAPKQMGLLREGSQGYVLVGLGGLWFGGGMVTPHPAGPSALETRLCARSFRCRTSTKRSRAKTILKFQRKGGVLMTKTLHQELEEILRGPVKTFIDPGGETRLSSQAISPLMEQLEHAFLEAAKRAKPTFAPEAGNGQARTAVNGYEYNLKREITGEEDYAV